MKTTYNTSVTTHCGLDSFGPNPMVLLGRFKVHPEYFELIEWRVADILPSLLEGQVYTPVELIGEDFWADVTTLGQRQAILSLKHMTAMPGSRLRQVEDAGSDLSTFEITVAKDAMRVPVSQN